MPTGTFHSDFVGYTGINGAEIVLYNLTSKSVCYFDLGTGNYVGSVFLPSWATANNTYFTAFANNRIWLFGSVGTSNWYGYEMPNIFSNTKGNPSDNCGIASVTLSDTMVSCPNSSVLVTATITDNSGNTFTSSATMTGIDTLKPVVSNKDTVRVYLAGTSVSMDTSLLTNSITENCTNSTLYA
jgi:large repetitive protein